MRLGLWGSVAAAGVSVYMILFSDAILQRNKLGLEFAVGQKMLGFEVLTFGLIAVFAFASDYFRGYGLSTS